MNNNPIDNHSGKIWYLDSMRETIHLQFVNLENFAKLLITIAATLLSLSIIALKIFLPTQEQGLTLLLTTTYPYITSLYISYFCFILAIFIAIISFLTVSTSINKHLKNYSQYYTDEGERMFTRLLKLTKVTKWLNMVAGISFVCALATLVLFFLKNLS